MSMVQVRHDRRPPTPDPSWRLRALSSTSTISTTVSPVATPHFPAYTRYSCFFCCCMLRQLALTRPTLLIRSSLFRTQPCLAASRTNHQPCTRAYHKQSRNLMSKVTQRKPLKLKDGPMVWIDCEMTGLDPNTEQLLEVAVRRQHFGLNFLKPELFVGCYNKRRP